MPCLSALGSLMVSAKPQVFTTSNDHVNFGTAFFMVSVLSIKSATLDGLVVFWLNVVKGCRVSLLP